MINYLFTIFLGAYLLFQIQPIVGKYILPWFGGGLMIWTACMFFFQVFLLGGYLYSHVSARIFSLKTQAMLHISLLVISLLLLPITPDPAWRVANVANPSIWIFALLTVSVGLPYLLLASTSPLLQSWFSLQFPLRNPYRLYALSNIGSVLGLLLYPFAVEITIGLSKQAIWWSIAYSLFAVSSIWSAWKIFGIKTFSSQSEVLSDTIPQREFSFYDGILLLVFSSCGSLLLISTTAQMTRNVPPNPFLWIVPLCLYLLSFVVCFDRERWYNRAVWIPVHIMALCFILAVQCFGPGGANIITKVIVYSFGLFSACMICHGEIVRLKPHTKSLTLFYLLISTGGALGGAFANLIAPVIFDDLWEYQAGLIISILIPAVCLLRNKEQSGTVRLRRLAGVSLGIAGVAIAVAFAYLGLLSRKNVIATHRNFYSTLAIREVHQGSDDWHRGLWHGEEMHGIQFSSESRRRWPTSYFGPDSGIGVAINRYRAIKKENSGLTGLRIGVIGLGVGTTAAYTQKGDIIRFYEIDPGVNYIANRYFSYLKDTDAKVKVVLGDGRISVEQEIQSGNLQKYDIFAVDAFNSDTIPIHLLTKEAAELYQRHLKPEGIFAVHISNYQLDLKPIVAALADLFDQQFLTIINLDKPSEGVRWSRWILVTSNQEFLNDEIVLARAKTRSDSENIDRILWTDDYSNLLQVLK